MDVVRDRWAVERLSVRCAAGRIRSGVSGPAREELRGMRLGLETSLGLRGVDCLATCLLLNPTASPQQRPGQRRNNGIPRLAARSLERRDVDVVDARDGL